MQGAPVEKNCINLGKLLTVSQLEKNHLEWSGLINQKDVTFNAEDIESIDGAAFQLIAFYVQSLRAKGCSINWDPIPSIKFIQAAETCGVFNIIDLDH